MEYSLDDNYLRALRNRDPEAENHLVWSFACQIKRSMRKRLRSFEMAEDATQETLLRVLLYFRAGKTLRVASSLPGFVRAVSTYVSLEMLRGNGAAVPDQLSEPVDSAADPENAALSAERKYILQRALCELDRGDALLLRRIFLEDVERDQLCREMKVSHDYLRVMVHRAKRRLQCAVLSDKQRRTTSIQARERRPIQGRPGMTYPY